MAYFVVGESLFLVIMFYAVWLGGSLVTFIDIPSILFIFLGTLGLMLVSHKMETIVNAHACIFDPKAKTETLNESAYFWLSMIRTLLIVGIIGTLIGLIQMLQNLSDPESIGPAMAIAYLTVLYSIILASLLPLPAYFIIKHRLMSLSEGQQSIKGDTSC